MSQVQSDYRGRGRGRGGYSNNNNANSYDDAGNTNGVGYASRRGGGATGGNNNGNTDGGFGNLVSRNTNANSAPSNNNTALPPNPAGRRQPHTGGGAGGERHTQNHHARGGGAGPRHYNNAHAGPSTASEGASTGYSSNAGGNNSMLPMPSASSSHHHHNNNQHSNGSTTSSGWHNNNNAGTPSPNRSLTHTNTSNNTTGSHHHHNHHGNNHHGGGYNNNNHNNNQQSNELSLSVMDMGLDFRSYQHVNDPSTGRPIVGNIVAFAADKVPDVFQPTVGLLVTMLHMYYIARNHETAKTWIRAYETVQRLFLESAQTAQTATSLSASFSSQLSNAQQQQGGNPRSGSNALNEPSQHAKDGAIRQAEDAIRIIATHESSQSHHPDPNLCERLLVLLDQQSGAKSSGGQVPSQRRVPPAPKATFCNLHLSDHRCHQDFSCNQVHLHQVGTIKHRVEYHCRLVQHLLTTNTPEEVDQRLRDSLFYAKFGNKVTIRANDGSWVPFFKTLYTPSRLDMALRKTANGHVKLQDASARQQGGSKPMDLNAPEAEVKSYLDEGCREVYTALQQRFASTAALQEQRAQIATSGFNAIVDGGEVADRASHNNSAKPSTASAATAGGERNVAQILTASMAQRATPQKQAPTTTTIGHHIDTPDSTPAKTFQLQSTPPSMMPWAASVTNEDADETLVREYVRLTGISEKEQQANEALLSALQVTGQSTSTPVTPESFTPLMHEVQMRRFQSEDDGSFRV